MANDLARTIERNRSIFTNLLKQLPSTDRDLHLPKLADAYQERIDDVLGQLDGAPPSVRTRRARPGIAAAPKLDTPVASAGPPESTSEPHIHDATCGHLREVVIARRADIIAGHARFCRRAFSD